MSVVKNDKVDDDDENNKLNLFLKQLGEDESSNSGQAAPLSRSVLIIGALYSATIFGAGTLVGLSYVKRKVDLDERNVQQQLQRQHEQELEHRINQEHAQRNSTQGEGARQANTNTNTNTNTHTSAAAKYSIRNRHSTLTITNNALTNNDNNNKKNCNNNSNNNTSDSRNDSTQSFRQSEGKMKPLSENSMKATVTMKQHHFIPLPPLTAKQRSYALRRSVSMLLSASCSVLSLSAVILYAAQQKLNITSFQDVAARLDAFIKNVKEKKRK